MNLHCITKNRNITMKKSFQLKKIQNKDLILLVQVTNEVLHNRIPVI